jgi:hypothetical protein
VSLLKGEYLLCAPVAVTMTWRPHIVVCVHSTRRAEGGRPEDRPTGPDHRKLKGRPAMTAESVAAIGAEVILPHLGSPPTSARSADVQDGMKHAPAPTIT